MIRTFFLIGFCLNSVICWKVLKNGQKTFVNLMFLMISIMNVPLIFFQSYFLLEVKGNHHTSFLVSNDIKTSCQGYIITWISSTITNGFFHVGIVFCRFIYARYAHLLMVSGVQLLHLLICIVIGAFMVQNLAIAPIKFLMMDADDFHLETFKGIGIFKER